MPLYFFHLNFGHRVLPDEEGVELPNRSAAARRRWQSCATWPIPRSGAIRGAGRAGSCRWPTMRVNSSARQLATPRLRLSGRMPLSFRPKNRRPSNASQPGQRRLCQRAADRRLSFGSFWRVSNTPHNCWNAIGSYGSTKNAGSRPPARGTVSPRLMPLTTTSQIGRERRQLIVFPFQPVVLDPHILALDKTGFVEAFAERGHKMRRGIG